MPPSVLFPRRSVTPARGVPPDALAWASRNVERIRTATSSGRLRFARWPDWHTDETPEIRRSYRKMLREPTLKAALGTKVLAVAALDAQAQPEDPDDPRHREQAEFLLWCLRRVGGRQAGANTYNLVGTRKIAWNVLAPGLIDGWSLNEMVWARDPVMRGRWAGKRCLADFKSKDTELLAPMVDEFQNVLGVRAAYNSGHVLKGEELEDCVLWANWALYEQPGGSSDFRAVYRAWWIKDTVWQLRGLHLEKYTGPFLKGTYADETLRPALEQALAGARAQTWIAVPEGTLIDAVELAARGTADFEAAIRDLDREMLVGTVGAYLHILEGQVSDGRGDTKVARETSELFQWLLAAVAGDVVTHQVAPRLLALNYANPGEHVVTWGAVSEQAMQQRAAVDQALQEIGLKLSAKETYAYYGRQPPADPADVLVPPPKQGGGGEGGAPGGTAPPPGGGGGGDALPFGEARSHCMEGPNAGKPGPCPEGGGVEPPQGPTARHLDELESLHEEMEEGNAQEVAGRAVKALAGAEAGIRQRADDAPEEFVAHMSDQLEEHVEDVAPQAVKDYRQAVGALAEDLAYTVREAHDALDELAVAMDEGADGDEVYELSSRFQEYLATAREAAAEYPRRQAAAWAEAERSAWEEAREADPERYCQSGPNAGKPGPCPTAQDHAREARKALTRSDRHAGTVKWHLPAGHPDAEALRESRANADAGSLPAATRAKEATRYAATLRAVGARLKAEGKTTAARAAEKAAAHADEAAAALGRAHETRQAERGAKAQAVKAADAAGERALDHAASLPGEHPLRPALARVEALALEAHDPHEQDLAVRRKAMEGLRGEAARASSRLATMDTSGMDEDALASHGAALASLRGVAREAGAAAKHLAAVSPRAHAEAGEEDDVQVRAEAIAEILAGLFGEDALRLLEEVDDPGEEGGVEKFSWNDIDHPRGPGGKFITKNSPEAVSAARDQVKQVLAGERTPDSLRKLTEHLSILTVKQLHDLRREHGLKASGRLKAELAAKIAEKLPHAGKVPGPAAPAESAPPGTFYHGTHQENVSAIEGQGLLRSEGGTAGAGVYLAGNAKDALFERNPQLSPSVREKGRQPDAVVPVRVKGKLFEAGVQDAKDGWSIYVRPHVHAAMEASGLPMGEVFGKEAEVLKQAGYVGVSWKFRDGRHGVIVFDPKDVDTKPLPHAGKSTAPPAPAAPAAKAPLPPADAPDAASAAAGRPGWSAPKEDRFGRTVIRHENGMAVEEEKGTHARRWAAVNPQTREVVGRYASPAEAVRAAENAGRFGAGQTTPERDVAALQARPKSPSAARPAAPAPAPAPATPAAPAASRLVIPPGQVPYPQSGKRLVVRRPPGGLQGMTNAELGQEVTARLANGEGAGEAKGELKRRRDYAMTWLGHRDVKGQEQARQVVEAELTAGRVVPPEVLAFYPDLVAKAKARGGPTQG